MNNNYILGIYAGFHGVSGTLLQNGCPIVAIQLERLVGIKRCWVIGQKYNQNIAYERVKKDFQKNLLNFDDYFNILIDYILKSANIKLMDIEIVALEKRNLFNSPFDSYIIDADNELDKYFSKNKIIQVEHHQGHLAQAFYPAPFSTAAIITIDGRSWDKVERVGDHISFTAALGEYPAITPVIEKTESLTSLYYDISEVLFQERYSEGKTMGLASLGAVELELYPEKREKYLSYFNQIEKIQQKESAPFTIDSGNDFLNIQGLTPIVKGSTPNEVQKITAYLCQKHYEANLINIVKDVKKIIPSDFLCIAGGGGLNSVANNKILDLNLFKDIFVFPNCGDEGLSMGFALWAYHQVHQSTKKWEMKNDFWGRIYTDKEISEILKRYHNQINVHRCTDETLLERVATMLFQGNVIGWFQGKSEFGPRSLGNRAILANPCLKGIQDIVNQKIKLREGWRPFAPCVKSDNARQFFNTSTSISNQYMLMVTTVYEEYKNLIPAVTHVDGTARVQVVDKQSNSRLYNLLDMFNRISSVPILLNTSFNLAGKPLVETPEQALDCFLGSHLDALVIENNLILK